LKYYFKSNNALISIKLLQASRRVVEKRVVEKRSNFFFKCTIIFSAVSQLRLISFYSCTLLMIYHILNTKIYNSITASPAYSATMFTLYTRSHTHDLANVGQQRTNMFMFVTRKYSLVVATKFPME